MKTSNFIICIVFLSFSLQSNAQKFDKLDKSPMDRAYYPANAAKRTFIKSEAKQAAAEPVIRVTYSRPAKKGRTIFGKMLKYGEVWRIGANESTEILFLTDVEFGGTAVKAGRYSLLVIPSENEWVLKLNTVLDGWGNYGYDSSYDIASSTATVKKDDKETEHLSMALYEASDNVVHLKIGWDTYSAEFPITLK